MGELSFSEIDKINWNFFQKILLHKFFLDNSNPKYEKGNFLHDLPWNHEICIYAKSAHLNSVFCKDFEFFHHSPPSRIAENPPTFNRYVLWSHLTSVESRDHLSSLCHRTVVKYGEITTLCTFYQWQQRL